MTKKPAKKKLRVGILFGGRSGEHEVSLKLHRDVDAHVNVIVTQDR